MPRDDASLVPLPSSAREDGAEKDSPSYQLEFSRNDPRLYQPVPVVLGNVRVVPPLGGKTISTVTNDQVIQQILVVWGFGPCSVTDIRISGRPLSEYEDISAETRQGRSTDAALTLYPGTPITTAHPMTHTALRVRVTDQLPRRVDEISGTVWSESLDWDTNSNTWISRATSNPASLMRLALQHPARRRPAPNAEIDLVTLQSFHAFCANNGYEFNAILDTRRSIWDVVTDICAVARARPTLVDGIWSVIWDVEDANPVEHFCTLNMDGFTVERSFERRPEAIEIRFPNRNKGWRRDTRTIYRSGSTASNATEIEYASPFGITSPDHVWKFGARLLAQQQESEVWSGVISAENVDVSRGDRVTVSHESIGAGIASAWVTGVGTSSGNDRDIDLDAAIDFGGGDWGAIIRTESNPDLVVRLLASTGGNTLTRVRMRAADRPTAGTIKVGDLISFGLIGNVRAEAIVKNVERQRDLKASISMVPFRQSVYDAEKGAIPAFTSSLEDISTPLPPLVINSIDSSLGVRQRIGTGVAPRMLVDVNPIPVAGSRIECQLRQPMASDYGPSEIESEGITQLTIGGLKAGSSYGVRARWILPEDNRVGDWTAETHNIEVLRPGNPSGFTVTEDDAGIRRFTWNNPSDDDFAGVRIRYGAAGTAWGGMTALHDGLIQASPWWAYEPGAGTYAFEIRAVDTDGLESTGVRLDGDDTVTLGNIRGLGRFHELTAFRKQSVGDAAPTRPTDGSYDFSTGTFTPPTGWVANWPAHESTEVVYAVAATAQDQEGDPWNADTDDWSTPAIISDAGDINIIYRRGTATGGTVVGTRATYAAPAAPDASAGVPTGWHDDIANVPAGPGLIYASVGLRRRGQSLFNWGTPEAFEGQPGVDGVSAIELPIYQKISNNAALPAAPSAAAWDHSARSLTGIGDWSVDFPSYNAATEKVACTITTAFANDTILAWSAVRVCEAAGDINAVYRRVAAGTTPAKPATGPARVPTGWTDISSDLSGNGLAWMTVGHRAIGQANWTWGTVSRIAALDGEDGEDGEPGRLGLTGSAGRITRATRVAARGDANTNTEWHMTATSFDGNRTINLGNVSATEKSLIELILTGGVVTLFHDPDNWADYNLSSVTYAAVGGNEQARIVLGYIEHVGVPPAVGDATGTTMHVHFTPQGVPGEEGTDGTDAPPSSRELIIYQKIGNGAALPAAPDVDDVTWNNTADSLTGIGSWTRVFPTYNAATERVVCASTTGLSNNTISAFSAVRVCEAAGALNIIYRRAARGTTPATPAAGTRRIPADWFDDPGSITGTGPAWASTGHRGWASNTWTWQASIRVEGLDGREITSITRNAGTGVVSVNFNRGDADTFTVVDGSDGTSITASFQTLANGDIRVTFSDGTSFDIPHADAGRGIQSISKTGEQVTVTYDDATTATFTVSDGTDGTDGDNGIGISRVTRNSGTGIVSVIKTEIGSTGTDTFAVPDGDDGTDGTDGRDGGPGPPGPPGPGTDVTAWYDSLRFVNWGPLSATEGVTPLGPKNEAGSPYVDCTLLTDVTFANSASADGSIAGTATASTNGVFRFFKRN